MFAFRGVDYLEIDGLLNDDEKLVRQMVREFVEKEIIPHIEEWNREGKFPLATGSADGGVGILRRQH